MYVPAVGGCHRIALLNLGIREEQFMPNTVAAIKQKNTMEIVCRSVKWSTIYFTI